MQISLKNKIILSITIIIFVFGGLAVTSVFFYSKDQIESRNKENISVLSSGITHSIANFFNHTSLIVKEASEHPIIIEYLESGAKEYQRPEVLQKLGEYNIGDVFSAVYLMLPDGTTVASTDEGFVGKNYGFRDYFKGALEGGSATDIVLGVTSGELGYYFAHSVTSLQGQVIGVAITKLKPEVVHNSVVAPKKEEGLNLTITDNYGVVIFSSKKGKIYNSLGQLNDTEQEAVSKGRRFSGVDIKPLSYDILQQNIHSVNETQVFELYDEVDEKTEIVSIAKVDGYPFFLVLSKDIEGAVSSSFNIAYILSGFVLVAALFAIISLTYLISIFMRPLRDLQDAAEKIEKGNMDYEIETNSKDEIGKLAQAFNKMITAIKESRKDVDRKVALQTKELARQKKEAENAASLATSTTEAMAGRELKMIELKKEIMELKNKVNDK